MEAGTAAAAAAVTGSPVSSLRWLQPTCVARCLRPRDPFLLLIQVMQAIAAAAVAAETTDGVQERRQTRTCLAV